MRGFLQHVLWITVASALQAPVAPGAPDASAPPTRRALLIGINDYLADDLPRDQIEDRTWIPADLTGAVNDIRLIRQVLTSRFGFEDSRIMTLTDSAATREAILQALARLAEESGPRDTVYVHFSGHGSQVEDQSGDEADDDGRDETILPHDARTGSVPDITDDEISRALGSLRAGNVLIVLDSCHSGTATRGGSLVRTRAVPADTRNRLYVPPVEEGPRTNSRKKSATRGIDTLPEAAGYVLMTGAAADQSALEGPVDGEDHGLFSYCLARSLGKAPEGATVGKVHREAKKQLERIGPQLGLVKIPDSQLEAPLRLANLPVLSGGDGAGEAGGTARLPWVEVRSEESGEIVLLRGVRLGGRPGSTWAVYPPGETQFPPGGALAVLTVHAVRGEDSVARLEGAGAPVPAGSRAVPLAPPAGPDRVPVRLDRIEPELRARLVQAIRDSGTDVALVGPGEFARFVVDVEDGTCRVLSAGGLQEVTSFSVSGAADAARRLARVFRRSVSVAELLAVDNLASRLTLDARALPVDSSGEVRGIRMVGASAAPAYRIRREGEPRSRVNSLRVEIRVSEDSYITVVDVDAEGTVQVLFPNVYSEERGFHPDGFVTGRQTIRLPDSLDSNSRAGFVWDYAPPAGIDTLRVFAATDLSTAEKIRAYVRQAQSPVRGSGSTTPQALVRDLFLGLAPGQGNRGVRVLSEGERAPQTGRPPRDVADAPATPPSPAPDWTATSITLVVEE